MPRRAVAAVRISSACISGSRRLELPRQPERLRRGRVPLVEEPRPHAVPGVLDEQVRQQAAGALGPRAVDRRGPRRGTPRATARASPASRPTAAAPAGRSRSPRRLRPFAASWMSGMPSAGLPAVAEHPAARERGQALRPLVAAVRGERLGTLRGGEQRLPVAEDLLRDAALRRGSRSSAAGRRSRAAPPPRAASPSPPPASPPGSRSVPAGAARRPVVADPRPPAARRGGRSTPRTRPPRCAASAAAWSRWSRAGSSAVSSPHGRTRLRRRRSQTAPRPARPAPRARPRPRRRGRAPLRRGARHAARGRRAARACPRAHGAPRDAATARRSGRRPNGRADAGTRGGLSSSSIRPASSAGSSAEGSMPIVASAAAIDCSSTSWVSATAATTRARFDFVRQ